MKIPSGCTVVFDYDCTLTSPEDLSRKFKRGYLAEISERFGQPIRLIEQISTEVESKMKKHPERYDWVFGGRAVSSMVGDPSLRFIGIVEEILRRYPNNVEDVDQLQHKLFWRHYPDNVRLRPGTQKILSTGLPPIIITNSPSGRVCDKLQKNLPNTVFQQLRIFGEAGKQFIDEGWEAVEPELSLRGLHRPVLLRRRQYFEVLTQILGETPWSDLVVVGDNFELDLALPMALGSYGILMTSDFTPRWETEFVSSHPRGRVVKSLF
jgi:FMN phosphatase YigB (HAD superfamily)